MPKLQVFVCSTRPGRVGLPVANWALERAKAHGKFEVELVDLKEVALPPMDEPHHPRLRQYEHAHTKAWSAKVASADAFVFVTPEYNFSSPPALVNAMDYLLHEWAYKPVGFVSYGGVSAGTRSMQMSKLLVTALRMMPLPDSVNVPFVGKLVKDGVFDPGDTQDKPMTAMLDELAKWTKAMEQLRAGALSA